MDSASARPATTHGSGQPLPHQKGEDVQAAVVVRVDDKHRYEILVDGELAGFAAYRDRDAQRVFYHTEIDYAFTGQGFASLLVRQALTDAHSSGKRIVPVCPFVAEFLRKHDEFADISNRVTAEVLEWLRTTLG